MRSQACRPATGGLGSGHICGYGPGPPAWALQLSRGPGSPACGTACRGGSGHIGRCVGGMGVCPAHPSPQQQQGHRVSCLTSMTLVVSSSDFKVCTVALHAFPCLFLMSDDMWTAQGTQSLALDLRWLWQSGPLLPCVLQQTQTLRLSCVRCTPAVMAPHSWAVQGGNGDIKAIGIPEDTQVRTAEAGSRQQVKMHIRLATCSERQAGVPTSRPPSGKANTRSTANVHRAAPRDGPEASSCWGDHTGRERCAVQTHTGVHQQLGSASVRGGRGSPPQRSISSGAPSGIPERCRSQRGCPMPVGVTMLRPRSREEPVSLPLLGTPTPMSRRGGGSTEGPAGASREPGGDPHRTITG